MVLTFCLLPSSFGRVNLFGRYEPRFRYLKRFSIIFNRAVETGFVTLVTGGADLFDLDQQRVAVAIEGDVLDGLGVAAGFALSGASGSRNASVR
jgi:hypothetical protein